MQEENKSQPDHEQGSDGATVIEPGDQSSRITDASMPSPEDHRVMEMLAESIDVPVLADAVARQEPPDAADTLESLEGDEASEVLELMADEAAANALAEMQTPLAASVIRDLIEDDPKYAGRLLELMAPDDAVDILQSVDRDQRSRLLSSIESKPAEELIELAAYDRESAGGIMTTDFLGLRDTMTVGHAIEYIRSVLPGEGTDVALVTDESGTLVGLVTLRQLLLATDDEQRITDLMERDVDAVLPDVDQEEVAQTFDRYDYSVLPVVNGAGKLLGLITVDDVIDIIRAEQTEDVQTSVGAGKGEAVYSSLLEKFRGRLPWLLVNLLTSSIAAIVVLQFDSLITQLAILAVLMPVIANQAGNAGQQSLAVTLRGIVLKEVRGDRISRLIVRESLVGLFNGMIAGLLVFTAVSVLTGAVTGASWKVGLVVAISMPIALSTGCLVGCSVPLIMWRLDRDPATASTIFLTMVTDSFSFLIFLGMALLLSDWLGVGTVPGT